MQGIINNYLNFEYLLIVAAVYKYVNIEKKALN